MDVTVGWGSERLPAAVLEQAWPRRAPRVLLGVAVLGRWWTRLRRWQRRSL